MERSAATAAFELAFEALDVLLHRAERRDSDST
jgi:hypothetical protein